MIVAIKLNYPPRVAVPAARPFGRPSVARGSSLGLLLLLACGAVQGGLLLVLVLAATLHGAPS